MKSKWSKITIDFYTTADGQAVEWMRVADFLTNKLQKEPYLVNDFKVYIDAELKIKPKKERWKFWK